MPLLVVRAKDMQFEVTEPDAVARAAFEPVGTSVFLCYYSSHQFLYILSSFDL